MMADSSSETDSSSVEMASLLSPVSLSKEQLTIRNEALQQENRALKTKLDAHKVRVRALEEENKALKQASVNMLAKAEQEEEYISNMLMRQINTLKKEKEVLALNYEEEEESLTNELSRKLSQLEHEKTQLVHTLEEKQEAQDSNLKKKIRKLESDIQSKQNDLEQLRREKVELENSLEQEQEGLLNRLWKRMDKLESEKRMLQERLDQQVSASQFEDIGDSNPATLLSHIETLRQEVASLKRESSVMQQQYSRNMAHLMTEEKNTKEEICLILDKKLQKEVEQGQAMSHQMSESESSVEMDEERHFPVCNKRGTSPSKPVWRPLSPATFAAFFTRDDYSVDHLPSTSTHSMQSSSTNDMQQQGDEMNFLSDDKSGAESNENFIKPAPPQ